MPLNVSQVMESLSDLYNSPGSDPLGNVIAFVGAKGGAGASTVCHNTAFAISQSVMSDVVIADLDLPFGTAGLDFFALPTPQLGAPHSVVDGAQRPDAHFDSGLGHFVAAKIALQLRGHVVGVVKGAPQHPGGDPLPDGEGTCVDRLG